MRTFVLFLERFAAAKSVEEEKALLHSYLEKLATKEQNAAVALLSGWTPEKRIKIKELRALVLRTTGLSERMFEVCLETCSDQTEVISLLFPEPDIPCKMLLSEIVCGIQEQGLTTDVLEKYIIEKWSLMNANERSLFNKLLLGTCKIPTVKQLLGIVLVDLFFVPRQAAEFFIASKKEPAIGNLRELLSLAAHQPKLQPLPFCRLKHWDESDDSDVGGLQGIAVRGSLRVQLVVSNTQHAVWTEEGSLLYNSNPIDTVETNEEVVSCILEGMLVHDSTENSRRLITKSSDQIFEVTDVLLANGRDIRNKPFHERWTYLPEFLHRQISAFKILPGLLFPVNGANNRIFDSANLGSQFRIFLKQKNAEYQTTLYSLPRTATRIQAILVYAEADSRTSFYRKFCFALPNEEGKLITIAKLEVELEEVELADLNQWIRTNVIQKFGPVRTVAPELVFDLEYDQLKVSPRHKSGFNLLGVRCIGRRRELSPSDATRLNAL